MIRNLVQGGIDIDPQQQVAHFKVAFVNAVSPSFLCSLCNELMKFPCHVNCCQNCFCQECIGRIKQMERPCPNCEEKNFLVISDRTDSEVKREIDSLKVYCPMRKNGCKWTGRLELLDDHLMWGEGDCLETTCRVIPVQCVRGCGSVIPRGIMKTHVRNSCKRRDVACKFCGITESYDQLTAVHYNICHKYHVTCPNGCKMPGIERSSLKSHLETECPLRTIPCEFHFAGCGEEVMIMDQSRHMTQSMTSHLSLLSTFARSVQVENKELRNSCKRLEKVCVSLQRDCASLATEFAKMQHPGAPQSFYQNGHTVQKNRIRRHPPPIPATPGSTNSLRTQANQSYSTAEMNNGGNPSQAVPEPQLGGIEIESLTPPEDSPPPPLPPRSHSLSENCSNLSVSSAEWLPNDSTDVSEDQLSPLSDEEDTFN